MSDDLERIDARLAEIEAEAEELKVAARVLRRLHGSNGKPVRQRRMPSESMPSISGADFSEMTIAQAATTLLKEYGGKGVHFREIAASALARGYKGRKDSSVKSITQSFWATMKRQPDVFEKLGEGMYRLKESA
jgi:hypothetical protein